MDYPFEVVAVRFDRFGALLVIAELADRSAWFVFTPYPDDEYEITVKAENEHILRRFIKVG